MRVPEKTLELNVGAEILNYFRYVCESKKTYLRGLTQVQESEEGFDFSVQLSPNARIAAFQFKAPIDTKYSRPYAFQFKREQHEILLNLAKQYKNSVFYVLPFYESYKKVYKHVPNLLQDTWFLPIESMNTSDIFCYRSRKASTRTMRCQQGRTGKNPEYELFQLQELNLCDEVGISIEEFWGWYRKLLLREKDQAYLDRRKSNYLKHVKGLKIAIIDKRPD